MPRLDDIEQSDGTPALTLAPVAPRPVSRVGRWRGWAAAATVVVTVAVALLVFNLLGDAALFFYNADEAVERRAELGSRRFKIQGTPLAAPSRVFQGDRPALRFEIAFNGVVVGVVHIGDPPDLFQPGVPVVLEGAWKRGLAAPDAVKSVAGLGRDTGLDAGDGFEADPVLDSDTGIDSGFYGGATDAYGQDAGSGVVESPADDSQSEDTLWHFASDRMMIKHDNDYRSRGGYQQRVDEAGVGGEVP